MSAQLFHVHLDPQPDIRPDELMLLLMLVEPGKRQLMSAHELEGIAQPLRRHLSITPDHFGSTGRLNPLGSS